MAFGGDDDRRTFALTVNWVFTCISLSAVTLRLVSRRLLERNRLEIEDGMIVMAMLVILSRTIWLSVNVSMGFGLHLSQLLREDPINAANLAPSSYGLTALSLWTFVFPKIPVVALLIRLFTTNNKRLGYLLWSALGLLIVWNAAMTIITFMKCDPVHKNWAPRVPGTCWNPQIYLSMGYFSGSYSAALDFLYALYPMFKVSQLQMEQSRKNIIVLSFSLGIPAGIVSIIKITTIKSLLDAGDPTFATVPLEVWNVVESTSLMIAATVPMTKPIMTLMFDRIKSITSYISGGTSRNTTSKGTKPNSLPASSGNFASARKGWHRQDSKEDILLDEIRVDNEIVVEKSYRGSSAV